MKRCDWANARPMEIEYHDMEWGVPVHDDQMLFEMLTLESAQSGLSWATILKKRAGYRKAFADFNISKVARYTDKKVDRLLQDAGIVRHRKKIESTIANAKSILVMQKEFGSFDSYIWSFVKGKTIDNARKIMANVPAKTTESEAMSKSLKKNGFKFLGPTTCYAFMQASGMVNDHLVSCFCYSKVK